MCQAFVTEDLALLKQPANANTLENPKSMQIQYVGTLDLGFRGLVRVLILHAVCNFGTTSYRVYRDIYMYKIIVYCNGIYIYICILLCQSIRTGMSCASTCYCLFFC